MNEQATAIVVDSIWDVSAVLDEIVTRLRRGEQP
jgi:hypothetical protein